ncbi:hypothetical protein VTI74DRAFT_5390 [Chaetomium olivicolor]
MGSPMAGMPFGTPSSLSAFDEKRETFRRLFTGAHDTDSEASQHSRRADILRRAYEHERSTGCDAIKSSAILEDAVVAARKAVEHTSTRDRFYRPARLSDLCRLLQMLYEHRTSQGHGQKTPESLRLRKEAIDMASQAAHTTPEGDRSGNRAARFSRLAHLQLDLGFKMTKNLQDLDKAIDAARTAVKATPPGSVYRAARLGFLAQALEARFKHRHNPADLREAITIAKLAVSVEGQDVRRASRQHRPHPPSQRGLAGRLGHLAAMCSSLWMLERHQGQVHLLDEAVRYAREAEALTPAGPSKALRLRNLSMMLVRRHEAGGSETKEKDIHLDEAVVLAKESVGRTMATTPEDQQILSSRLTNLSRVLLARYEHLGKDVDLTKATENAERALRLPATKWTRCCTLNLLATIYQLRFRDSLNSEHLEKAIEFARRAVTEMPTAGILSNLANALEMGYKRFRARGYLSEALHYAEEALRISAASQYTDSDRAARHSDLASILETSARTRRDDGASGDMKKALQHALRAVELTQPSDPHRPRRLSVLGSTLAGIPQRAPNIQDPALDGVIKSVEETIDSGAVRGPYLGALQSNLGRMFELNGDRDKARAVYEKVAMSRSSPPLMRILALRRAGILYAERGAWLRALDMFGEAISLLSNGETLQSLRLDDHEHTLSQLSGLSALSAAAALEAHNLRPDSHHEALVWAERGRGVIAKLAVNTPLRLIPDAPDKPKTDDGPGMSLRRLLSKSRAAWQNWGKKSAAASTQGSIKIGGVLSYVETQLTDANLRELAKPGPIVSFNATIYGTNGAFIITASHGVHFEPLCDLRYNELERYARLLNDLKNSSQHRMEATATLKDILPWLWRNAVRPVLEYLEFRGDPGPDGRPRRVWWVSSGLLGSFPLHAAGTDWSKDSTECALRRVVSSYVPSVMGLLLGRQARRHIQLLPSTSNTNNDPRKRLLFIAVPQPINSRMDRLNVTAELDALEQSAGSSSAFAIQKIENPPKATVLDLLARDSAPIVHFACHGTSEQEKPSKSALLLRTERLTAGELMTMMHTNMAEAGRGRLRLVRAELAYISACSTAKNGCPDLVDEAIHLASALFLIGFPNVVGPLWEALDKAAPRVTGQFYEHLAEALKGGKEKGMGMGMGKARGKENGEHDEGLRQRAVADALHKTTLEWVKTPRGTRDLTNWASFVHIGV